MADSSGADDAWPLTCPVCDAPLAEGLGVLACAAGHSYDVAREGYVNLLAAGDRERGIDGDTTDMVRARRRFLDAGFYAPLLDRLARHVGVALQGGAAAGHPVGRVCVAEIGCGDGYYIAGIAQRLAAPATVRCVGVDVSKAAVRLAARRHRGVRFMVANVRRRVYLATASVDALLSVFAPRNPAEFGRLVRPGGSLVVAIPAPDHLASVRAELDLIGVQQAKESHLARQFSDGFTLAEREVVSYPLALTDDAVRDLVDMGPNRWHDPADRSGASDGQAAAGGVTTEAAFVVLRYERRG